MCFKIDKTLMHAAGMTSRVRQEVSIHSRLKHPSILELYTFFEDTNYVYLVLELCHNGELQRYLKRKTIILTEEAGTYIYYSFRNMYGTYQELPIFEVGL